MFKFKTQKNMKKAILIIVLLVLTAIQGLFYYAYSTGKFADIYHSFGQDLPILYKPIAMLLDSKIGYRIILAEFILGLVFVVKDKFKQIYVLFGLMTIIILMMIYGLYGNAFMP